MNKKLKRNLFNLMIFVLIIAVFSVFETMEAEATTAFIQKFVEGKTYNYDLDGNGSKEKIKFIKTSNDTASFKYDLYINDKLVTSIENKNNNSDSVYLYDFNIKDKSREICIEGNDSIKIVKYNEGKYFIKNIDHATGIDSYNRNTGVIKVGRFSEKNKNLIGYFSDYKVSDYKIEKQPIDYEINENMKSTKYKALENVKTYKYPNSSKVAYTIKKGDIVYANATYSNGTSNYIRFNSKSGKQGWVKVAELSKLPTNMFKRIVYRTH